MAVTPLFGKRARTALNVGLAAAGLGVIGLLVWKTGWTGIWEGIRRIGPWFPALVALNLVTQAAFVLGLRTVMAPRPPWPRFPRLYRIYLMGDAANYLAPGGGEAAKAHFLRNVGGGAAAMAAIALHKHADLLAQCMFAVAGVGAALIWFDLPRPVVLAAIAGTLLLVLALLFVTWALRRGAFSPTLRRLARWKFLAARLQRFQTGARDVDARIADFHTAHRARFFAAAGFCLVGYCGGLVETWIVLSLLAPSAGWPARIVVESLPMVLNNAVLFVPGKLGGAEGIRTGVFLLVGLTASQGAAYAFLRRARELVWVIPGWALLIRERLRRKAAAARVEAKKPKDV